jgi:CheY-like chemotaxis protein
VKNSSKILVVDDEPDVVQALRFRLETAGCMVLTASNGREALDRLAANRVDLILADFMMPALNGLELAVIVQQKPWCAGTKVVLFSCHADPRVRAKAAQAGVLDYLLKADGAGAIVRRVCTLLNFADSRLPVEIQVGASVAAVSDPLCALAAANAGSQQEARGPVLSTGNGSTESTGNEEQQEFAGSLGDDLLRLRTSIEIDSRRAVKPRHS